MCGTSFGMTRRFVSRRAIKRVAAWIAEHGAPSIVGARAMAHGSALLRPQRQTL